MRWKVSRTLKILFNPSKNKYNFSFCLHSFEMALVWYSFRGLDSLVCFSFLLSHTHKSSHWRQMNFMAIQTNAKLMNWYCVSQNNTIFCLFFFTSMNRQFEVVNALKNSSWRQKLKLRILSNFECSSAICRRFFLRNFIDDIGARARRQRRGRRRRREQIKKKTLFKNSIRHEIELLMFGTWGENIFNDVFRLRLEINKTKLNYERQPAKQWIDKRCKWEKTLARGHRMNEFLLILQSRLCAIVCWNVFQSMCWRDIWTYHLLLLAIQLNAFAYQLIQISNSHYLTTIAADARHTSTVCVRSFCSPTKKSFIFTRCLFVFSSPCVFCRQVQKQT